MVPGKSATSVSARRAVPQGQGTPGTVAGLAAVHGHGGRLPWAEVLAPRVFRLGLRLQF